MATLNKIRNQSGLLLAVIGIAMLAFILGDFMQSKRAGGSQTMFVGEVNGEEILRQKFEIKVEEGINNYKDQNPQAILTQTLTSQIRSQVWDQYVRELIMNYEYQKLGIDVSDEEFFELLQGVNVHPEISKISAFQNPQTGQFDRSKVLGYLQQIDQDPTGEARNRWVGFQKYLVELIKTSKHNTLVGKSMYISSDYARIISNEKREKIEFQYITIPYTSIPDSLVEPSEKEIKKYYNNHESEYQQELSKDINFVVFQVVPSIEDDNQTRLDLEEVLKEFANYEDYNIIARRNSDNTNAKFSFVKENDLEDPNWKELFNKQKGTTIGPYLERSGIYRIAKLVEIEYRPDSVEARHILIKPTEQMDLDSVNQKINNLQKQVEQGVDFGDLARVNSEDQGSAIKGGDLGWFKEGVMVEEFNESCFTAKLGELKIVTSQFGVHLIEVTKSSKKVKKVKIAYIDRNIEPSTETFNTYYSQAARFASKVLNEGVSFDSLVFQDNLVKRVDNKITKDKQAITGLPNSRELVRWVNSTNEERKISEVFQFDDSYVVAYLNKIHKEGVAPLEDVKDQIRALVLKEKKFQRISQKKYSNLSLEQIALKEKKELLKSTAIFSNINIDGIGYEPELVGSIFSVDQNIVSEPIKGRNSCFIFEIKENTFDKDQISRDLSQEKKKIQEESENYSKGVIYNIIKEESKVVDNRSDFY